MDFYATNFEIIKGDSIEKHIGFPISEEDKLMYTPEQRQPQNKQEVCEKRQERKDAAKAKKEAAKKKAASKLQEQFIPSDDKELLANVSGKDKTPLSAIFLGPPC